MMMTQCTMNPGETAPDTDICVSIYEACAYICKYFMYISQPEFTLASFPPTVWRIHSAVVQYISYFSHTRIIESDIIQLLWNESRL